MSVAGRRLCGVGSYTWVPRRISHSLSAREARGGGRWGQTSYLSPLHLLGYGEVFPHGTWGKNSLSEKFQQEFLITCFLIRWFDKIVVFDLDWSCVGQVGSWDLGRKDDFGAQRFQFWGDYGIGADHEEIGPCSVENEEVGTLRGKKVYQDVGEEHKKRSGIPFQTMKLLSYLREKVLHFCLDLSAWLCEWLQVIYTWVFECLVVLSQTWGWFLGYNHETGVVPALCSPPEETLGKSVVGACMWAWG